MREFEPLMYTQEVMDYVEEMSYITSEEEVEKYYINRLMTKSHIAWRISFKVQLILRENMPL